VDEMGRACSTHEEEEEEKKKAYRILMGNTEGKRRLGRPSGRLGDGIEIYLTEIGWGGMD
jgi:hypothetical protein